MKQTQPTRLGLSLAAILLLVSVTTFSTINITPIPRQLVIGRGTLDINNRLEIEVTDLPDSIACEALMFAQNINSTTSIHANIVANAKGNIRLVCDRSIPAEGYSLTVTPKRAVIRASTGAGFFYAFQTITRLLPPNIAVGVRDTTIHKFALPPFFSDR